MKLTPLTSQKIGAPGIAESPVNIECKVVQELALGSHTMFVGQVVNVTVEDTYLNDSRSTTGDAHVWLRANTGTNGQRKRAHYNQDYTTTIEIPTMKVTTKRWYSGNLENRKYLG